MALPYKKWTDDEIKERNITDEGNYPFKIIEAIQKKTKGGFDKNGEQKEIHDMLEMDFEFTDTNGMVKKQRDWIVFSEGMDWKLRHLANAIGVLNFYDNQQLESHHLKNKTGIFSLGIKEFTGNNGEKKKINFVKDYVKKSAAQMQEESKPSLHEDVPF